MKSKTVIIILMYNDSDSTLELLDNIESYTELEKIIVVDNCSQNNSYSVVKARENDHIHVIKTQCNEGIAAGNNFGAQYAKKICPDVENYLFSNPDVIVNQESIKAMNEFLMNNKEAGAVCPLEWTKEEEPARDFAWRLPTYRQFLLSVIPIYTKIAQKYCHPYLWFYDVNKAMKQDVFWAEVIISCFIMIRRDAFEAIGGFSERTFLYHEEDILSYEFAQKGIKQAVLTRYKVVHLGCTSMNKSYKNWVKKSDILFDSSIIYLEDCLHISKAGIWLYRLLYKISLLQRAFYHKVTYRKEN